VNVIGQRSAVSQTGSAFLSARSIAWGYDPLGQVIAADSSLNTADRSYQYDAQSRRIAKTTGTNKYVFLYNGWNSIADYSLSSNQFTLQKTRLWGTDLSGSMQRAGGVGGLLLITDHSALFTSHYPTYDGNGNVSEYLTATGSVAAHYEYDPFGNTVVNTDTSNQFIYKFSTKPVDQETGLYYYGYRYYDPLTGRWPPRDPIEEVGGSNLYGFVENNSIIWFDRWGLLLTKSNGAATYQYSGTLPFNTPAGTVRPEFVINPKITPNGETAKLEITGQLPRIIVLLNSNRPDLAIIRDDFGNNVGEHEKVHVFNWRDNWNAMSDNLSSLDGKYCPAVCASVAAKSAKIIRDIFYANALVANASFDLGAYPVEVAETPGEEARLNKIIRDGENAKKQGQIKLKQLENEWTSNKCKKQ
jgi:RHS repeat-associated protein